MSVVRQWPTCFVCSDSHKGWYPVEEYEMETRAPRGPSYRACFRVIGRCSHGRDFKQGTVREQVSDWVDVPLWWGEQHVKDAVQALVFFQSGVGAPEHGLVTRIA